MGHVLGGLFRLLHRHGIQMISEPSSGQRSIIQSRVFVDPGKHACGVSHWINDTFRGAWLVEGSRYDMAMFTVSLEPDLLVCEIPVSYNIAKQIGDQNDLIQVAISAGAVLATSGKVQTVTPGEWKGQVPKKIHHQRLWPRLTPDMLRSIHAVKENVRHNVIDAVALGMWWLDTRPLDRG